MQKLIIGISPNVTIEIANDDVKKTVEQAAFWNSLPAECPICKASLVFFHRTPKDNVYYGQACTGPVRHESNFGEYKATERGLYYKGEWGAAFGAYQNDPAAGQGEERGGGQQQQNHSPAPTGDPVARTLGDMVTAKQLGMIRAVSRDMNIDPDNECQAFLRCKVDELSKRAASDFIEHLQGMQRAGAQPIRTAADEMRTATVTTPDPGPAPANPGTQPHIAPPSHGPACTCPDCDIPF